MKQYYGRSLLEEIQEGYAFQKEEGWELVSNDRSIILFLGRKSMFTENGSQVFYSTTYYIKEDGSNGWEKSVDSESFRSMADFMRSFARAEEFSKAYNEIRDLLRETDNSFDFD